MKRGLFLPILVLLLAGLALAGCRKGAPINDLSHTFPPTSGQFTAAKVEDAIIRAGTDLGWQITRVGPGEMEGAILVRGKHRVQVSIPYDVTNKTYAIKYKSSSNMEYNAENRTIHPNYNSWIQRLDTAIANEISRIQ